MTTFLDRQTNHVWYHALFLLETFFLFFLKLIKREVGARNSFCIEFAFVSGLELLLLLNFLADFLDQLCMLIL